jgi:hypothetical protein
VRRLTPCDPAVARSARQVLAAATREDTFTRDLLDLARLTGWRSAHFRPARTAQGWRTPVAGDGKGWPDLVLLRGGRIIVAELKQEGKYPGPEQRAWLEAWRSTPAEVHVWRPSDWPSIVQTLT